MKIDVKLNTGLLISP